MRVLPAAPGSRSRLADDWAGIHQQSVVRIDEPEVSQPGRDMVAQLPPLLREDAPLRPAGALVEQHCAVPREVEVPSGVCRAARPWTTVHIDDRQTLWEPTNLL